MLRSKVCIAGNFFSFQEYCTLHFCLELENQDKIPLQQIRCSNCLRFLRDFESSLVVLQLPMKAAADEVSASLRLRPPVRTGSVAWSHKESGIDERVISSRDCLKPLSKRDRPGVIYIIYILYC